MHALHEYQEPSPITSAGPMPVPEHWDFREVPTTLGDLIAALQEATPDDRLVLAAVNDLMTHGRLKKRADA